MSLDEQMDVVSPVRNVRRQLRSRVPWLSHDLWTSWDKTGKIEFYTKCKECLRLEKQSTRDTMSNNRVLVEAIYELVLSGMKRIIPRDRVIGMLKLLLAVNPAKFSSLLSDVWSTIDSISFSRGTEGSARRDIFVQFTKELANPFFYLFEEKLDSELFSENGIMTSGEIKQYQQKFIRLKTKTYYKQQKFNLFREEPEGYGKLIAELCRPLEKTTYTYMLNVVHSLIGTCYLDPNRVLDIVLEAFERQPKSDFFIPLLEQLKPEPNTICEILAFKLKHVESSRSLFNLIALLLQHKIILLDAIYPWLKPDNRIIEKQWERQLTEAQMYAKQAMRVRLDGKEDNGPTLDEDENLVEDRSTYTENEKLLLCKALLDIGAWDVVHNLLQRHPKFSLVSCAPVARSLVRLINYLIDPIYNTISDLGGKRKVRRPYYWLNNPKAPVQISDYDKVEESIHIILALGPYIHCDPILIYKIIRIIKFYLEGVQGKPKTEIYYTFIDVLDEVLLPALCYLDANCAIAKELWTVLEHYPYQIRFRLYGSWKSEEKARIHPTLLRKRVDHLKNVKHLMRRISKENVKFMGRQLGKLTHSIPAIVFDYILSQIQLFDNLTTPVIDALKYLSPLGYDILGYCLLEALSPHAPQNNKKNSDLSVMLGDRARTKHDGSTIAPWIQYLSTFAGNICKKYSLDLVPLLQYIANQLKAKESLDLLLLKQIVEKMTGIEAAEDITSEQLEAMSGGELLKSEAGYFGQLRTAKKSATRLREATAHNDLAITLCILMSQQRNRIIYDESQVGLHTKLVGKLYDQCQDTLVQFGTFLATSCTLDEYARKIPQLETLVDEYHVDCDVAFFLWRPVFSHLILSKYEELRRASKAHKKLTQIQLEGVYANASESVLEPVVSVMKSYLPPKTWEDVSPQFFVTFWSLTLYDLWVPSEAYTREVLRIKQLAATAAENKEFTSSKRRKEQERCSQLIDKLQDEQRRQSEHVRRVLAKLEKEKDFWFAPRTQKSAKNEAVTAFLQLCLFPRCIFTAPDSLYCAQFVKTIHLLQTPNFSTLICYDRVFCDIIYTVTSCTENEANRYGRFLNALLTTVMKWHGDKNIFQQECASFPGFVTKFRATNTSLAESNDHVDYENYRHVCHKWHYKITKCVIVCLESKDFTQIRNALIVLKRILPSFPRVINLANAVEKWVERVRGEQKDKRQDLFALATSYIGQLKAKMPSLIPEEAFHQKATPEKTQVQAVKTDSKVQKIVEVPKATGKTSQQDTKDGKGESIGQRADETKLPKVVTKADEGKTLKPETKTVRIKTSEIKGNNVSDGSTKVTSTSSSGGSNGAEKAKISRKIEIKSSSKEKDIKRRKIDDSPSPSSSTNTKSKYTSKK